MIMVIQGIQLKLTDRVDSMEVPNCSENLIYDVVNRMVVKIVMTNLFQLAAGYYIVCNVLLLSDTSGGTTAVSVVGIVEDQEGFSILFLVGSDGFRFLEHAPPFFPLPFGIVVSANFDKFGTFLLFLNHSMNWG